MLISLVGALYAKAPIAEPNSVDFESVVDSSRYFVVRLRNDNGQQAFVGIGFGDRADSFDLNVAIQDHFKLIRRDEAQEKAAASAPKLDLGFRCVYCFVFWCLIMLRSFAFCREGQTITVNIGVSRFASIFNYTLVRCCI